MGDISNMTSALVGPSFFLCFVFRQADEGPTPELADYSRGVIDDFLAPILATRSPSWNVGRSVCAICRSFWVGITCRGPEKSDCAGRLPRLLTMDVGRVDWGGDVGVPCAEDGAQ